MSSTVYLVGAGPGDPDLLTRRALRLLQSADVVLHDDLVSADVLQLVRRGALTQNVGKRCGQKRITQEEIHMRMIEAARKGQTVVRLKGGDPLLFGRAGEEMDALRRAGIEFEVVPGVTAAFAAAAAAKIPLTDRRGTSRVVFLTAHSCGADIQRDFGKDIASGTTVAIYMPGRDYDRLQKRLLASGVGPQTPCVLVSCASLPDESSHFTVLADLADAPHVLSPSILLIGLLAAPRPQTDFVKKRLSAPSGLINRLSSLLPNWSTTADVIGRVWDGL